MKDTNAGYRLSFEDPKGKHIGTHIYKIEKDAWTDARALSIVEECWNITVIWADTKQPTTTYAMLRAR